MVRLAVCWLVLPFLLFSASSGKLGTYILPCFPPLAFLIAVGLLRCLGEGDTKGFVTGVWVVMLGAGSLFIALIVALFTVPDMYDRVTLWGWGSAAAGLFVWVVLCRAATARHRVHSQLILYCAGPVLFMFSWHFISAAALSPTKAPGEFLLSHASCTSGNSIFIAENDLAGGVCWYSKRDDVIITGGTGELAYGLSYEDSQRRLFSVEHIKELIERRTREERVILVVGARYYTQCTAQLPKPCQEERHGKLVWAEYPPPERSRFSEPAE